MDADLHKYAAQQLLASEYGNRLVLLRPGTKLPAFKGWAQETVTIARIEWAFRREAYNLGLRVGPLADDSQPFPIVADWESPEAQEEARRRFHVPESPMVTLEFPRIVDSRKAV